MELIKTYTIYLASAVEAVAAIIIALAGFQAIYHALRLFLIRPPEPEQRKIDVRLGLGRWLSLSFEFMLENRYFSNLA